VNGLFKIWIGILIVTVFFFGFRGELLAQTNTQVSKRFEKQLEEAKELYSVLEWDAAERELVDLTKKAPEYAEAWLLLAQMGVETENQDMAYRAFNKLTSIDPKKYKKLFAELAKIEYDMGNYIKAHDHLHKARVPYHDPSFRLHDRLHFAINQIRVGRNHDKPVSLGINSYDDEYFPSLTVDGKSLVFTRQERDSLGKGRPGQEDLYESLYTDSTFSEARIFPQPITTPGNEGTQSVRQDGRLMFFTACKRPDSKGGCDIYVSRKQDGFWDIPVNVDYPINSRYWESTPFLTLDGRSLFFSSTRPGGFGGMDIWVSQWSPDGGWSEPVNAGPSINTSRDELAPYVHGDGKSIYFSSSGWVGMGGQDLFVAVKKGKKWTKPVNLGYPVNSNKEEMGISFHFQNNLALFSSNRDSASGRDILKFYLPDSLAPKQLAMVSGEVLNARSKKPISAIVLVQNQEGELISRVESDPGTGKYMIGLPVDEDHRFVVNRQGFLFYSAYLPSDSLHPGKSFDWDILLEPLTLGSKVVLRNVFFDTDSFTIKKESFPELLELVDLLSSSSQTNIEIGGHTDNTGDYNYNLNLSKARAESVRKFLVSQGVDPVRLTAAGYGPDEPIAENDTEQGRADNRRTEIKITATRNP